MFESHCDTILSSKDHAALLTSLRVIRTLLSKEAEVEAELDRVCANKALVRRLCDLIGAGSTSTIKYEAAWAVTNITSGASKHCRVAMEQGALTRFMDGLSDASDPTLVEQCIWGLGNIAGDSVAQRDACLRAGALGAIMSLLPHHNAAAARTFSGELMRNAVWTLSNMARGKPQPDFDGDQRELMACLSRLLADASGSAQGQTWACTPPGGSLPVVTDAAWGLSYLTDGRDDRLEAICAITAPSGACPGVIRQLVDQLHSNDAGLVTASLRTVGNIVTGSARHVKAVVQAGFLDKVVTLMGHSKRVIRKEACWALSNITADTDAHKQLVIAVPGCPRMLLARVQDSIEVAKEAAWVLSNLFNQSKASVVCSAVAGGYLGVLLACTARLTPEDERGATVCKEGVDTVVESCQAHPMVFDAVRSQVLGCDAYPALLECGGETAEALVEALQDTCGDQLRRLMTGKSTLDSAVATLKAVLDGTAPPVAFGAGSGAQASAKGKTDPAGDASTSNKGASVPARRSNGGTPADATAAVAATLSSTQSQPPASAEPTPDNKFNFHF